MPGAFALPTGAHPLAFPLVHRCLATAIVTLHAPLAPGRATFCRDFGTNLAWLALLPRQAGDYRRITPSRVGTAARAGVSGAWGSIVVVGLTVELYLFS